MTEIATKDWFGRWGTSVFFENTAIFLFVFLVLRKFLKFRTPEKNAIIILKLEQYCFTTEQWSKDAEEMRMANSVDPDQTAPSVDPD